MRPEEFRAAGHELIDWIADYRARIPQLPVQARVGPGEVAGKLPGRAPEEAEAFARVLADLEDVVVPGVTQVQHPRYFGWFPSNASLSSVLGDLAASGLGALGITWQSAPALTEVEEVVVEWLRELTGLPESWKGVIQDTASTGCLVALLAARERATDYAEARGGLQAEGASLTVYTTRHAHSSVPKAAALAGYGQDNVRFVDVDPVTYAMSPEALASALEADVAGGRRPAVVVATVGTTGTTAVDPLAQVVPLARRYGAWVHVDAAMAGSALLLPEMRWLVDGVAGADSLVWNPHKWLGTVLDCSLLYVADPGHLVRVMSTNPSYLRSAVDGEVTQYKDWGIPLGRRFRALKLWFHLRLDGVEAIRARLRRDLDNARWLAGQVSSTPGWRVLAPVNLQTVVLRHEPAGLVSEGGTVLDADALNAHTLSWVDWVNSSGAALVTPSLLDGLWSVRVSIGAEATEREDVFELWTLLQQAAGSQLAADLRVVRREEPERLLVAVGSCGHSERDQQFVHVEPDIGGEGASPADAPGHRELRFGVPAARLRPAHLDALASLEHVADHGGGRHLLAGLDGGRDVLGHVDLKPLVHAAGQLVGDPPAVPPRVIRHRFGDDTVAEGVDRARPAEVDTLVDTLRNQVADVTQRVEVAGPGGEADADDLGLLADLDTEQARDPQAERVGLGYPPGAGSRCKPEHRGRDQQGHAGNGSDRNPGGRAPQRRHDRHQRRPPGTRGGARLPLAGSRGTGGGRLPRRLAVPSGRVGQGPFSGQARGMRWLSPCGRPNTPGAVNKPGCTTHAYRRARITQQTGLTTLRGTGRVAVLLSASVASASGRPTVPRR
jgi:aromatic-L-amino-acid/L-tryptophan decarboxylase